jgi:hypothetical protein
LGSVFSQNTENQQLNNIIESQYYQLFDQIVGIENTEIYNGTEIIELHRVVKGKNKYFFRDSFVPATVIFDGQSYYNIELNYNFYEDFIILRLKNNVGKNTFKPIQEKVEGFIFGKYEFKNFTSLDPQKLNGYYQILKKNNAVTLLRKHKLGRKSNVERKVLFYEFEPIDSNFFIEKDGRLSEINSKSDWLKLYPNNGSEIRKYFRKNKKLRRLYFDEFTRNLFFSVSN